MLRKILLAAIAMLPIISCSKNPAEEGELPLLQLPDGLKTDIVLDPEGDVVNFRFDAAAPWTVQLSGDADWLEVSPMSGSPGTGRIKVQVETNLTDSHRKAEMKVVAHEHELVYRFSQAPYAPTLELVSNEGEITSLGGAYTVKVLTDVVYECFIDADWVREPVTKAPRVREHIFNVDPNPLSEKRSATITFTYGSMSEVFTLSQREHGTEADDWMYEDFVRRSLAMRFTADWCGYCPVMADAFDMAKIQMPHDVEMAAFHGNKSTYEFSGTSKLIDRFLTGSFPTGVVDARASIPSYASAILIASILTDVVKESFATYPSTVGIEFNSTLSGDALDVDLSLYIKEADTYRVSVLLLEDGIVGYQNGKGSAYEHNNVVRLAFTSGMGDTFKTEEDNQIWKSSYSAAVSSGWDRENLKILVYVEKPYGEQDKVHGVEYAYYHDFGDTYVDNCRVAGIGEAIKLEFK